MEYVWAVSTSEPQNLLLSLITLHMANPPCLS